MNYPLQEPEDAMKKILEELKEYKKKINRMHKSVIQMRGWIKKEEERQDDKILYFLLGLLLGVLSVMIIFLIK
jgi:hypothetical protein